MHACLGPRAADRWVVSSMRHGVDVDVALQDPHHIDELSVDALVRWYRQRLRAPAAIGTERCRPYNIRVSAHGAARASDGIRITFRIQHVSWYEVTPDDVQLFAKLLADPDDDCNHPPPHAPAACFSGRVREGPFVVSSTRRRRPHAHGGTKRSGRRGGPPMAAAARLRSVGA